MKIVFLVFVFILTGCTGILPQANPIETQVSPTVETAPTETPIPKERGEITLEDVKNVESPLKISIDEKGTFTGFPEGVPSELLIEIIGQYYAVQKKFLMSDVFYSHDPETNNWLVYATLGEKMFYANNPDPGRDNYPDYPLIFTKNSDGMFEISGQYGLVDIPDTLSVAWKNGVPQFLTEVYNATDGNTYAKKYFDYETKMKENPWRKMSELFAMPREAESTAPSELDLNPTYMEAIDQEFMGVRINAELITSYDPVLTKIYIPENAYAEFIARTIFKVWWKKGDNPQTAPTTEADFQNFMKLWANAQETNNVEDWKIVQLNNIWANDLKDGKGYVQKPYTIWPMFTGEAPEEVKGINKMSLAIVDTTKSKNISLGTEINGSTWGYGLGTNFEISTLYMLLGATTFTWYKVNSQRVYVAAGLCNSVQDWLIRNKSGDLTDNLLKTTDLELFNFLLNNRLTVTP